MSMAMKCRIHRPDCGLGRSFHREFPLNFASSRRRCREVLIKCADERIHFAQNVPPRSLATHA